MASLVADTETRRDETRETTSSANKQRECRARKILQTATRRLLDARGLFAIMLITLLQLNTFRVKLFFILRNKTSFLGSSPASRRAGVFNFRKEQKNPIELDLFLINLLLISWSALHCLALLPAAEQAKGTKRVELTFIGQFLTACIWHCSNYNAHVRAAAGLVSDGGRRR